MHHPKRSGNEFNPGQGRPTRFAFFTDASNPYAGPVPTLYAAATSEAAVCESILHDVPVTGGSLPEGSYATRTVTAIKLTRSVRLAMLMGPGLRRLKVTPQQLTATDADVYDQTVQWAEAAHAAGFDGLAWMSARDNTAEAYVFFGDRVAESAFEVTSHGHGSFAPGTDGFAWLSAYCALVHVELLLA